MPFYLNRFRYTAERWRALIADPVDRTEPIRQAIEQAGGTLHGLYFAFGSADGYLLAEFPDNVAAAATAILAASTGSDQAAETIVLLTPAELLAAVRQAGALTGRAGDRSAAAPGTTS